MITRLDGIPPEYYNYSFTFDDETIEGIAKTLKNVLSFDIEEMEEISKKAYSYISDKKNYIVQTRKIIDFFQTCTYQ